MLCITKLSNTENKTRTLHGSDYGVSEGPIEEPARSLRKPFCDDIRSCAVRTHPPRCRWQSPSITCSSGERPPSPLPSWSERSSLSDYSTTVATRSLSIWIVGWVEGFVRFNACFYLTLQIEGEAELMLSTLACPLSLTTSRFRD